MAKLKAYIKPDHVNIDGKVNIKIRVSHQGKVRYIASPWHVTPRYNKDGSVKSSVPASAKLDGALLLLLKEYNDIIVDVGTDISFMSINSLISKLKAQTTVGSSFSTYLEHRIKLLKAEGRHGYAMSYEVTRDHLNRFTHNRDILFKEITISFLNDFKSHLSQVRGNRTNTIRIYLNNIRAVFYDAIDNDIVKADLSPFRKFKIAQEKTKPKPIDVIDMRKLLYLRFALTKQQKRALDMFFLIFYLCGINLKDLVYLKPENIVDGRIEYNRFKTGRSYSIKITPQAQEILIRYQGTKYLLNFMDEKEKVSPERIPEAHHDVLSQMNKLLKTITNKYELNMRLKTYTPRYSWATIASKLEISHDIIAHVLGHGLDTMTDLYIDFDLKSMDQANEKVIKKLIG